MHKNKLCIKGQNVSNHTASLSCAFIRENTVYINQMDLIVNSVAFRPLFVHLFACVSSLAEYVVLCMARVQGFLNNK